jgi:hypothetical protein
MALIAAPDGKIEIYRLSFAYEEEVNIDSGGELKGSLAPFLYLYQ